MNIILSVQLRMSDSEDFIDDDAAQDTLDVLAVPDPRSKSGKRGKNIPWQEVSKFATNADFFPSSKSFRLPALNFFSCTA